MRVRFEFVVAVIALSWLAAACGPYAPPLAPNTTDGTILRTGTIRYEARHETYTGISAALEERPARFLNLVFLDPSGIELARGRTNEQGHFSLSVPAAATRLQVEARVELDGIDLLVSEDRAGMRPYVWERSFDQTPIVLRDDEPGGPAGALHILDTSLRGAEAVRLWTGRTLPPFSAYWGRGVTTSWSYYHGQCSPRSERFCVELLGGGPGQQRSTDTDEHDEGIILHEFGHFVMDRLSTNSSHGGNHSGEILIDPGLAWEEGRASWFAMSVLGHPRYRDTIGMEGSGSLRIDFDFEQGRESGLRGLGSEPGVSEILWDLSDGADGTMDRDHDGAAVGPAALLSAMIELASVPGAFVAIDTFLWYIVQRGITTEETVKSVLRRGGHPLTLMVMDSSRRWPRALSLPGAVGDKVDGLSEPAPSGGVARPQNGYDALRQYIIEVPRRGRLSLRLQIDGSGRPADHTDVDLELRDMRAELLEASRSRSAIEALSRVVEPGFYVIYVRDGGGGNRVGFELTARLD